MTKIINKYVLLNPKTYTMKYIFLIITLLLTSTNYAQKIGTVPLVEIEAEYIKLTLVATTFSSKKNIYIDYGQEVKGVFTNKERLLNNDDDAPMVFYSDIGAINYMYKSGYQLIKIYLIKAEKDSTQTFILRRKSSITNCTQNTFSNYQE